MTIGKFANVNLLKAMDELDTWLVKSQRRVHLKIIGAFALQLQSVEIERETADIDTAVELPNSEVLAKIGEIGRFHGLDETWLEHSDVPVPKDAKWEEAPLFDIFKNISGEVLSVRDLIVLKVASYFDRRHITSRDLEDLKGIVNGGGEITPEILKRAESFIIKTRPSNPERLKVVMEKVKSLVK